VSTDWDQGSLWLDEMEKVYELIKETQAVLGIDICGECEEWTSTEEIEKNNRANRKIWDML